MPYCFIVQDVFSQQECRLIIEEGKAAAQEQATVKTTHGVTYDRGIRECNLAWFSPEVPDYDWFMQRVAKHIIAVNQDVWHFDLDGKKEYAQFASYGTDHKFDWHTDAGEAEVSQRKLGCVIHLNDPGEYQGGELQLFAINNPRPAPQDVGSLIIFPAYVLHRVLPVTSGHRYTLVQWMSGMTAFR
jgi:PKHD-type hydroxylase